MSNLTDLGLVEVAGTDVVKNWPAQVDALLNALAALRYRDQAVPAAATATAALATAALDVAPPAGARVSVTLDRQCRVKVTCQGSVNMGGATGGRWIIQCGYNAGAFNFAAVVKIGTPYNIAADGTNRQRSGIVVASVLLPAGTYSFYPVCQRQAGGQATDTFDTFMTMVEVVSLV